MNNKKSTTKYLFILLTLEIIYWIFQVITRGKWMDSYFVNDFHDVGMDYFNMLANIFYGDPYVNNSNYPAFCFLVWRVLAHIMPFNTDFTDGFYLQNYMPAQLGYILFNLFNIVLIWELTKYITRDLDVNSTLLSTCVIFSGPFLYTLERGNIIIFAFSMILLFFAFYDEDQAWKRYLSYIALAIATAIKIYPALFGIMILQKKRFKEAAITVGIGVFVFVAPFFAFDGLNSIKAMWTGIQISSENGLSIGSNYNFSADNFCNIIAEIFHHKFEVPSWLILTVILFLCGALLVLSKELWKKILAIALLCIWIPSFSYTYTLLLLVVPFIYFVSSEKKKENFTKYFCAGCFLIILLPLALPQVGLSAEEGVKFPLTYSTLLVNVAIALLYVVSLGDSIINKKSTKEKNG